MPEGRILLKAISQSKKLSRLKTDGARLLYSWIIPQVDINGCFSGDAHVINSIVFTRLGRSVETIEEYLQDLEGQKLILRYEANGDIFILVPNFKEKQPKLRPDHEAKPTIPLPNKEQLEAYSNQTTTQLQPKDDQTTSIDGTSKVKESKVNKDMRISSATPALLFPLRDGTDYPLELAKISQYEKTYRNIDVPQELTNCLQWDIDNAEQRKTKTGILKHINFWLNRASKDKGPGIQAGIEHDDTAVEEARKDKEEYDPGKARANLERLAALGEKATKRVL